MPANQYTNNIILEDSTVSIKRKKLRYNYKNDVGMQMKLKKNQEKLLNLKATFFVCV